MKVLIADDEEHVREGIVLSVDWDAYGVTEKYMAANGMEALEIISAHQPDILFCDMKMPMMNGTELLKKIREQGFHTQVIVISGFNDFEYTRATIQANAVDYILKPFRKKEVDEAFGKAVAAWKERTESLQVELERAFLLRKADAVLDEKKLASYFRNEIPLTDGVKRKIDKTGLRQYDLQCIMVIPKNLTHVLKDRFMMDDDLLLFSVDNITRHSLSGQAGHYLCKLDAYRWVLLIAFTNKEMGRADIQFYLDRLRRAWMQTLKLDVVLAASKGALQLTDIHRAIGEAQNALLHVNIREGKVEPGVDQPLPSLMSQEILLRQAIETGNRTLAQAAVQHYAAKLRSRGNLLLKELQSCTMEANLLLGRYSQLITSGAGTVETASIPLWVSHVSEWEQIFISQMDVLLDQMSDCSTGMQYIQEIRKYIDQHFQKDITLKDISDHFHFSPQYISKKFRETYGTTITAYVTNMKIEKAKALLLHTKSSVTDISIQLGYDDENYFSKVFKKQTGRPPLQYRKETSH